MKCANGANKGAKGANDAGGGRTSHLVKLSPPDIIIIIYLLVLRGTQCNYNRSKSSKFRIEKKALCSSAEMV